MPADARQPNTNQQRAILWKDGPLLVLAGPGSGKTRVLTARVARILKDDPDAAVLALTFTHKAATEMREKLEALLGVRTERAKLTTFHAFAVDTLRQHGSHVGMRPDFSLIPLDADRLELLTSIAKSLEDEGEEPFADRHRLLKMMDYLYRELYDGGAEAPGFRETPLWVPRLFEMYNEALIQANRQDFGSLLYSLARLLRERPGVAQLIRLTWSHVCVDEFQDTNKVQFELLKLLVPPESNPDLFVVGDDDQVLYQWNGASPERLKALQHDYNMEVIQLPKNYRCPPEIVAVANRLIEHNRSRDPAREPLTPTRAAKDGEVIQLCSHLNDQEEAAWVAEHIAARVPNAKNCVVLARTGRLLEGVAQALRNVGLTPHLAKKRNDLDTPPVRVVIQALRLAATRADREILRQLCVAWSRLTEETLELEEVVALATTAGDDYLRGWSDAVAQRLEERPDWPELNHIEDLHGQLRDRLVDGFDPAGLIAGFLETAQATWAARFGADLQEELEIWKDLAVTTAPPNPRTLSAYLQAMDLTPKVTPRPPGSVPCYTVHGAKGLEFDHVYLIGMAQEVFPSFQALRSSQRERALEEERRSCFVAITRAQETLTITWAQRYNGWDKVPSMFLAEMFGSGPEDEGA